MPYSFASLNCQMSLTVPQVAKPIEVRSVTFDSSMKLMSMVYAR
jgi:hypothetical protein